LSFYQASRVAENGKVAEAIAVAIIRRRKFATNKLIVKISCTNVAVT